MPITLGVGPTDATDNVVTTSIAVTLNGVTAGRSLVVAIRWLNATATLSSVSCTSESNLTLSTRAFESGTSRSIQFATLDNVTTSGNKTITATFSSATAHRGIVAIEVIGANRTSMVDVTAQATNAGSANPSVSISPTSNNDMLLGVAWTSGGAVTPGSGYTSFTVGATTGSAGGEYNLDAGASGSKTLDFTATTGSWALNAIALKFDPSVPAGGLAISGLASTVRVATAITPSTGAITATGNIPNFTAPRSPLVGQVALVGLAGQALNSNTPITVAVGNISFGSFASVTRTNTPITPSVGAAALAGAQALIAVNGPVVMEQLTATGVSVQSPATSGSAALQLITATGIIQSPNNAVGTATLEFMAAAGYAGTFGAATLQAVTASAQAGNYVTGSATLLPLFAPSASGYAVIERVVAVGYGGPSIPEIYKTVVMNARTTAVTEYQNYNFNSYAFINGSYYAASPSGLYRLDGATDDGADISWSLKTGQMDNKSAALKRLPEVMIGLRADGPVRVRIWPDDSQHFDYMLPATKKDTIHQQRVLPGKGMRSRYYSVELQGVSNSAAEIDSLQPNMINLTRRVG